MTQISQESTYNGSPYYLTRVQDVTAGLVSDFRQSDCELDCDVAWSEGFQIQMCEDSQQSFLWVEKEDEFWRGGQKHKSTASTVEQICFFILKMTLENKNKWIKNEQKTSESHHLFIELVLQSSWLSQLLGYLHVNKLNIWSSWSCCHTIYITLKVYFEKVKDTQVLKQIHINTLHRDTNTNMNAMPALDFFGDVCAQYNTFCSIAVLCALILKGKKIRPLEVTD